mgnify:CR=1 FL=1
MLPARTSNPTRLLEYDAIRHRLWIGGQRCHHGAGGSLVTLLACLGLMAGQARPAPEPQRTPRSLVALALAGGALMAHDWKDHAVWFARGA